MTEVKWIKICTDIFDDEKILLIENLPDADSIIVLWFKLLCLAGKQNNNGVFIMGNRLPYTDSMLATIFRRKEKFVQRALKVFEQYGMIIIINDTITVPNWEKHQNLDKLEQAREQTRKRVARHRERQKEITESNALCNGNVTRYSSVTVTESNVLRNSDVTPTDKDIDKDKDIYNVNYIWDNNEICDCITANGERCKRRATYRINGQRYCNQHSRGIVSDAINEANKEKSVTSSIIRFVKPSLEEVHEYCQERKNNVDAQRWFDYYSANGWKVGKNPMKDWKAAVRTWERNEDKVSSTAIDSKVDNINSTFDASYFDDWASYTVPNLSKRKVDKNEKQFK